MLGLTEKAQRDSVLVDTPAGSGRSDLNDLGLLEGLASLKLVEDGLGRPLMALAAVGGSTLDRC